jgi:hypothetical protein
MPQLGAVNDSRLLQFDCMISGARRAFLINKDLFLKIKRILNVARLNAVH